MAHNTQKGTYGHQIEYWLREYSQFLGCFAAGSCPELEKGQCIITNISKLPPGRHWCSIARDYFHGHLYFFDSLGGSMDSLRFMYPYQSNLLVVFNKSRMMRDTSTFCAQFSSAFISWFCDSPDLSFTELLSYHGMSRDLKMNENIVNKYIDEELNVLH